MKGVNLLALIVGSAFVAVGVTGFSGTIEGAPWQYFVLIVLGLMLGALGWSRQ
jgi:hypothetical protein